MAAARSEFFRPEDEAPKQGANHCLRAGKLDWQMDKERQSQKHVSQEGIARHTLYNLSHVCAAKTPAKTLLLSTASSIGLGYHPEVLTAMRYKCKTALRCPICLI